MTIIDLSKLDSELCNAVYIALCFSILFSAEFASVSLQRYAGHLEENFGHTYIYITYTLGLWLAPPIVYATGPCWALVLGSCGFMYHLMTYNAENLWVMLVSTMIGGIGASVLWTAQGTYIMTNSTRTTLMRNNGIFWTLFGVAELFGNIVLYHRFEEKLLPGSTMVRTLLYAMYVLGALATVMFFFLQNPEQQENPEDESQQEAPTACKAIQSTWNLMWSKNLLILTGLFVYSGLEQTFAFGVYSSHVGYADSFSAYTSGFLALSSMYIGTGQIMGGAVQVFLYHEINKARSNLMILVLLVQLLLYLTTFLTLPNNLDNQTTHLAPHILPNEYVALLGSFIYGITDSIITVQTFTLLGTLYHDKKAEIAALYKFIKGVTTAIFYYFGGHWFLCTYLAILTPLAIISTAAFCYINKEYIEVEQTGDENVTIIAEMSEIRNEGGDDNSTDDGSQRSLVVDL